MLYTVHGLHEIVSRRQYLQIHYICCCFGSNTMSACSEHITMHDERHNVIEHSTHVMAVLYCKMLITLVAHSLKNFMITISYRGYVLHKLSAIE